MSTTQEIFIKCTKTKITIIILFVIFIYLLMFKLLINERFYIYNNSKIFKISEKVILTKRLLRIAQIAPPEFSVPPKTYGGIERTISYLTEELVKRGHDVTLFATTDSITSAKLVAKWPAFNKSSAPMERYEWTYDQVRKNVTKFDILHFHTDEILEVIDDIVKENKTSCVVTIHTPIEWYTSLGFEYNRIPIITISDEQKLHASGKPNFAGTAYHGLPKEHYKFIEYPKGKKPYLAFLGRMVPEKRPDMAIEIAMKAGYNLKMAAKVNKKDKYWKETIKPLIEANKNSVEFIGEINDKQKNEFLGNALAFIFPINWNEQFGMVMIESMACGTPVIARRMGSIIENGISGIIFNTVEEGVEAVKKAIKINRKAVREAFERRFTIEKNVDRIEEIYKKILKMREG